MDRRRMALDCLEVERLGYSVLDFLREQGAISPWGTWWRLQVEELGRARYQVRDGKENKMAKKNNVLTPEVRTDAEKMIAEGRDPKTIQIYLADHGSKNPSAHLYAIKNGMKKKAQQKDELAGFVPMDLKKKKPEKVTFNGKEFEKMDKPSPTCCQPAKPSGVTVPDQLPEEKQKRPAIRIREADGAVGTWRNTSERFISFKMPARGPEDEDQEIELTAEEWLAISAELPNVLELFRIKEAGA